MKRDSLYSSPRKRQAPVVDQAAPVIERPAVPSPKPYKRYENAVLLGAGLLVVLCIVALQAALRPAAPVLTPEALEAAIVRTLATKTLPSPAARAYQAVREQIVRVRAIGDALEQDEYIQRAVGSGVVIVDKGVI